MRGIVSNAVNPAKDYVGSVLWFKAAVDLIVLGREAWKDVHREVRGSVFQRSFLLGARRLYLEAYINAVCSMVHSAESILFFSHLPFFHL